MADIIQTLWVGESLGLIERLALTSFVHHGHEVHLYCYNELRNAPHGVTTVDANDILPEASVFRYQRGPGRGSVASFADLFRYKLLFERGGWWVDTDIVCLRPFHFDDDIVFADEDKKWWSRQVTNAVMKLPARHDVAWECYQEAGRIAATSQTYGETAGCLLGRLVAKRSLQKYVWNAKTFCPIPWWKWRVAAIPGANRKWSKYISDESYAVHLWHELWRRAGLNVQELFAHGSLVKDLQNRYNAD